MRIPALIPLLALLSLPSCGEEAGVTAKARRAAEQISQSAQTTLDKLKESEVGGLRDPVMTLNAALRAKDFEKAGAAAGRIDGLLHSDVVAPVVGILRILESDGVKKAEAAVAEHLKRPDLRESDRRAFQQVMDELSSARNHDIAAIAGGIVYIALEDKLSHSAAVPSGMVQVLIESLPIGRRDPKPPPPGPPPAPSGNAAAPAGSAGGGESGR